MPPKKQMTEEQMAADEKEIQDIKKSLFDEGFEVAQEVFKTKTPSFEQASSMARVLGDDVDRDSLVVYMKAAKEICAKYSATDHDSLMFALSVVIDGDEDLLTDAAEKMKSMFGALVSFEAIGDYFDFVYAMEE